MHYNQQQNHATFDWCLEFSCNSNIIISHTDAPSLRIELLHQTLVGTQRRNAGSGGTLSP